MMKFEQILDPQTDDILLDVGGYPGTWTTRPQRTQRIDCMNVHPVTWNESSSPNHRISTTVGDGCSLGYSGGSYDIVFSNSVIEHVGDWERQRAFANEARRVGKSLWIQTPAFECPLECHYLAPFVHWFPVRIRRRLLRWVTPWGWMTKPSQEEVDESIAFTRLLTKKQVRELFPDCVVMTERLLWCFPKSYVAYRLNSDKCAAPHADATTHDCR
jgi:hypothetical protein